MAIITFVGDCHYQFHKMYLELLKYQDRTGIKIDAIVQIGDFGVDLHDTEWNYLWNISKEVRIPTWVCMGNHEDYASIKLWMSDPDRIRDLHLLPDGGVTNVAGVQIASVWGNYSPKSWMNPEYVRNARANNSSLKAMHIYRPAVNSLLDYVGPVDVLITHDCSSAIVPQGFGGKPVPQWLGPILGLDSDERTPPGCPGFSQLLDKFNPKYYFFGHFHVRDYREVAGTKVICLHAFDMSPNDAVEIVEFT